MDRELKIVLGLYGFLLVLSGFLLDRLAAISPLQAGFWAGFIPFLILLAPYLLFSSRQFEARLRKFARARAQNVWMLPLGLLGAYAVTALSHGRLDGILFLKLAAWLAALVWIAAFEPPERLPLYSREIFAAFLLWLPIEFGQFSGFDIIFSEGIQIPALPFLAPVIGLYVFSTLTGLEGIGYTFAWRPGDLAKAGAALAFLAALLVPIGTRSGFISFSNPDASPAEVVKIFLGVYFLVAIPEELLFRGIFQNIFEKTLGGVRGGKGIALLAAALLFGLSHYNNFDPPDWRYVWLAALAGIFYGWTYRKTGKTTVSALVHCGVNVTWAILFKGTGG